MAAPEAHKKAHAGPKVWHDLSPEERDKLLQSRKYQKQFDYVRHPERDFICARDVKRVFNELGQTVTMDEIWETLDEYDTSHNGEIEYGEFAKMMFKHERRKADRRSRKLTLAHVHHYKETLTGAFNKFLPSDVWLTRTQAILGQHGFTQANTIPCLSICRDEANGGITDAITRTWSQPFLMGSLAGFLFLGPTGLSAAVHHAPEEHDEETGHSAREKYLFIVLMHIALDAEAKEFGSCFRHNRESESTACGALIGVRDFLKGATPENITAASTGFDPREPEMSLLMRQLIAPNVEGITTNRPDLVAVTKMALEVSTQKMVELILETNKQGARIVDPAVADYAVLSGIVVHAPNYSDLIVPGTSYLVTPEHPEGRPFVIDPHHQHHRSG